DPRGSYAYNVLGTGISGGGGIDAYSGFGLGTAALAQGGLPFRPISESQVKKPSEMFAISDAQGVLRALGLPPEGGPFITPSDFFVDPAGPPEVQQHRHGKGFNFVYGDGHVALVKRSYFINVTNSSQNWNNDHQQHIETWLYPASGE